MVAWHNLSGWSPSDFWCYWSIVQNWNLVLCYPATFLEYVPFLNQNWNCPMNQWCWLEHCTCKKQRQQHLPEVTAQGLINTRVSPSYWYFPLEWNGTWPCHNKIRTSLWEQYCDIKAKTKECHHMCQRMTWWGPLTVAKQCHCESWDTFLATKALWKGSAMGEPGRWEFL